MRVRVAVGIVTVGLLLGAGVTAYQRSNEMPGEPFAGPPPPADAEERALAARLAADVATLADDIGERHERRYGALLEETLSESSVEVVCELESYSEYVVTDGDERGRRHPPGDRRIGRLHPRPTRRAASG